MDSVDDLGEMVVLSRGELRTHIEDVLGIPMVHHVKYADRYEARRHPFYIKSSRTKPLVVHPDWQEDLRRNPVPGLDFGDDYYLNSALKDFPKLKGPDREPCGVDLDVRDIETLETLLARIGAIPAPMAAIAMPVIKTPAGLSATVTIPSVALSVPERLPSDPLTDLEQAEANSEFVGLSPTERDAVTKARIGQGRFRIALNTVWGSRCAVTAIGIPALLRASHIKPWRSSDNTERLDPENGLLLAATLDAAFDAGLVSFGDDGKMLFSGSLGALPETVLGIVPGAGGLRQKPTSQQQAYLQHHRNEVFRP